jgi:putative ABC transport system permease protein
LRSALTSLGILIGIAAVVIVVSLGEGARERVGSQLQSLGENLIYVFPEPTAKSGARSLFSGPGGLTLGDAEALRRDASALAAVTVYSSVRLPVQSSFGNEQVDVVGADEFYAQVRGYQIGLGRDLLPSDVTGKAKVVLIGQTVQQKLFGELDPVGHLLRIGRHSYLVVGVLASKGQSPFGVDQDDRMVLPISSWFARVSPNPIQRVQIIMGQAKQDTLVDQAERQVVDILRQRHGIEDGHDPDFQIRTQKQFQETQSQIAEVISLLLLSVAGIALFVGGVGVMNIMLVSVNERKREIGVRMAIGARAADIRLQFLVEAVALTLLGGVLGLLLAAAVVVSLQGMFEGVLRFNLASVGIALGTSLATGLVFGLLPAHRAAQLDPIEALRHE